MICTKAYIKSVPEEGSNIFKVEVPLMEDNTGTEAIFDALLCTVPGHYKGLEVGDTVFVEFEDDQYNTAIILGELFTEIPTKSTTYSIINDLKVTDTASLPPNTRFGDYTAQDIMNLYNKGGGAGTINDDDLKQYVQWINTETTTSEGDVIDVYADKIRVMSGQEYDALIEELGSEGVEEDINFINTLHFLWSIPGTTPTEGGGDDEGGDEGSEGGDDQESENDKYSNKKLVDYILNTFCNSKKIIATVTNYPRGTDWRRINADMISYSINMSMRSGTESYMYWPDITGRDNYNYYSFFYGTAITNNSKKYESDWERLPNMSKSKFHIGDVITFLNGGEYVYVGVYAGTVTIDGVQIKDAILCGGNLHNYKGSGYSNIAPGQKGLTRATVCTISDNKLVSKTYNESSNESLGNYSESSFTFTSCNVTRYKG